MVFKEVVSQYGKQVEKVLSEGKHGVFVVTDTNNNKTVMKILSRKGKYEANAISEEHVADLIYDQKPKHIIPVVSITVTDDHYIMEYEHATKDLLDYYGELCDTKKEIEDDLVFEYSKSILLAIDFIHSNKLAHMDIKAANLVIKENGELCLIDFDLCIRNKPTYSVRGTDRYFSPEIKRLDKIWDDLTEEQKNDPKNYYDPQKSDVYSAGLTILELYDNDCSQTNIDNIFKHKNEYPFFDLLSKMLKVDPNERYTIKQCLEHEVFQESDDDSDVDELDDVDEISDVGELKKSVCTII
jgi:serine/threonine protein kinase